MSAHTDVGTSELTWAPWEVPRSLTEFCMVPQHPVILILNPPSPASTCTAPPNMGLGRPSLFTETRGDFGSSTGGLGCCRQIGPRRVSHTL